MGLSTSLDILENRKYLTSSEI